MNVCCFRELEDVNVFLFRVIEFLQFVFESELAEAFWVQCGNLERETDPSRAQRGC